MLMVISNENIVRVYRIFLKITAIGMKEVKSWAAGSTYKSFQDAIFKNRRLRVEREDNEPVEKVSFLKPLLLLDLK
jgi:hypothetical protein